VQEAHRSCDWTTYGTPRDIHFGQPHAPMAKHAGKLAIALVAPRVVAVLWWEYLLFLVGTWFFVVLLLCWLYGSLQDSSSVMLLPMLPSMTVFLYRVVSTTPLNMADGSRFVVNALTVCSVALSFMLLFAKMWNDAGEISWWLVLFFPLCVITRCIVDLGWSLKNDVQATAYARLGYGEEGSAWEYAFSEHDASDDVLFDEVRRGAASRERAGADVIPSASVPVPAPAPVPSSPARASAAIAAAGGSNAGSNRGSPIRGRSPTRRQPRLGRPFGETAAAAARSTPPPPPPPQQQSRPSTPGGSSSVGFSRPSTPGSQFGANRNFGANAFVRHSRNASGASGVSHTDVHFSNDGDAA